MLDNSKYGIKYVCIYLRKSRGDEEKDLEKHRIILTDLCKKYKFTYVEYTEVGTSDSIDMRPKMKKLLAEIEQGIYDAVCIVDFDRLSRGDMGDQDRIKKAFQRSNTLIITPEKIFNLNDETDETYTEYKGFMARQEFKAIVKRLRQGKQVGARRGDWTNGKPPFPYEYQKYEDKYNERGLVVNDEKLPTYRYIIERALSDVPPYKIAWELNQQGIKSPSGNTWNNVTVYRILVDETHLGKVISNKTLGDAHKVKKANAKQYKKVSKEEWSIVDNRHEAVKTPVEHERILELLNRRNKTPTRARASVYSLSGLLKCGICGHGLTFQKKQKGSLLIKPCWYTDEYGNKCGNRGTKYSVVEDEIIKAILKHKEDILQADADTQENNNLEYVKQLLQQKNSDLGKYTKALERVNDAYDLGEYTKDEWIRRKSKWEQQISNTKNEIHSLEMQIYRSESMSSAERLNLINEFIDNIDKIKDPADRNRLYKTIIDSIVWTKKGEDASIEINFL